MKMEMKVEIVSTETIKASSPTRDISKGYKLCLLDELAPPSYVPILLFYPPPTDFSPQTLKASLSETLNRFYPFAGKLKENISFDNSNQGVLFLETKVDISASEIINDPQTDILHQLLPLDPYKPTVGTETTITGVQVNVFTCGSIGLGICVSHKVADAASLSCFLQAWALTTTGIDRTLTPRLNSSLLFPPKGLDLIKPSDMINDEKVKTRRFVFNSKNLETLKSSIDNGKFKPTRVEAVTTLIWKIAIEVVRKNSGKNTVPKSIITHQVNFRQRMDPPLPESSLGNLCRLAVAAYLDVNKDMELEDLVGIMRKSIKKIDGEYLKSLQGVDGLAKAIEPLKELRQLAMGGQGAEVFVFSSWIRFPLYEIDFGWGKPVRACTITVPVRNCVILMPMRFGDGIEAWVTLNENDMAEFESNEELLRFVLANK